jgi:protein HIRA/HIR1
VVPFDGITETTDSLLLEEKSKAGEIKHVEGRMGALMGDGAVVRVRLL